MKPLDVAQDGECKNSAGLGRYEALAVSLAPIYLLATGRWGAYLRPPGVPAYIGDLLLVFGLVVLIISLPNRSRLRPRASGAVLLAVAVLLSWVLLRFLQGENYGLEASRDAAIYIYAVEAWLIALVSPAGYSIAIRWVRWALWLHAFWCVPSILGLIPAPLTRVEVAPGVLLFEVRSDFDTVVLGVTAAVLWFRTSKEGMTKWSIATIPIVAAVIQQQSRAGLPGAFAALGTWFALSQGERPRAATATLVVSPLLIGFILTLQLGLGAPASSIDRFGASVGLVAPKSAEQLGAVSTQLARVSAWKAVLQHTTTYHAELTGFGFGQNYVVDSGAYLYLSSSLEVRAPHNWLISVYARIGAIGLFLWLLCCGTLAVRGFRLASRPLTLPSALGGRHEGTILAAALLIGLFVAAQMGVIMESPFGALPFYWCLGWLSCTSNLQSTATSDSHDVGGAE